MCLSLPAFWEKEPIAWFKCVDVFFASQCICKRSEMFDHVLKRLPPKYLAPLSDVITKCSQSINFFFFYFILISIFILLTRRKATEALYIG